MTEAIFRDIGQRDLSGADPYAAVLRDANLDGIIVDEIQMVQDGASGGRCIYSMEMLL